MNSFKETNKRIEEAVVSGYKKMEEGVTEGYRKIEDGVVSGYKKIEDRFVERFFARDGESIAEAKRRIISGGKEE